MVKKTSSEGLSSMRTELLVGISFFVAGIMLWMSTIGIISKDVVWANILMIVGIIFTAKEVYMSFRK